METQERLWNSAAPSQLLRNPDYAQNPLPNLSTRAWLRELLIDSY